MLCPKKEKETYFFLLLLLELKQLHHSRNAMVTPSDSNDVLDNNSHTIPESYQQQEESSDEFIHLHNVASRSNETPSLSLSSSEKTQQLQQQDNTVNSSDIAIVQKPRPVTHVRQLFVGNVKHAYCYHYYYYLLLHKYTYIDRCLFYIRNLIFIHING